MSSESEALNVSSLSLCSENLQRTRPRLSAVSILLPEFALDKCHPFYTGSPLI